MTFDAKTYVEASPHHGRGLFARNALSTDDIIGIYPMIILSADDVEKIHDTPVYHYIFYVDDEADGRLRAAIVFGDLSMCNHSTSANARFHVDAPSRTVTLIANSDIAADEEILIDYEEFAEEIV
ncbi:SET domain-containing protein [Parvularcula sp. LCG005]|uniref:SET domain-containing protein n=1 Tax=Parvularcula sp. LCG005 TaxID=3078805 RepID=UPI002943B1BA|nr:SET domain-containing protein-lysine N-methyltransferase [Parvularcula sp. LCG005]WOI52394.1 SET domain-containing protein-lysine N-methyltransferase [Parvularcula sp. LCG005]